MKIEKIKKLLKSEHYDFLRANEHLGSNIILLGLGGVSCLWYRYRKLRSGY